MKWNVYNENTRIKTFFAILPVRIKSEVRWLEKVTVKQIFIEQHISHLGEFFGEYWKDVEFIN